MNRYFQQRVAARIGQNLAGCLVVGCCLLVTGCPDKSTPQPSGHAATAPEKNATETDTKESPEVTAALALLEKNRGTFVKNAAGTVIAVKLDLDRVDADDSEDNAEQTRPETLFDAINTLTDLEKITLEGPGINDACMLRLTNLKSVTSANFKNANITIDAVQHIAETMTRLTDLSVNRCLNLDGKTLTLIAKEMPQLKVLDVQSGAFKTFDLRALSGHPALEQLDLRQCTKIEGDALKYVAEIPNLKVLRLRGADASFRDSSIRFLAGHPALKAFFLQDSNVSDDSLESLMTIPTLIDLSLFRLVNISNDGLAKLEGSKLQRLFLRGNDNIDDEGIAVLKTMPDLDRLILYEISGVTDAGLIEALSDNTKLRALTLIGMELITDKSNDAMKKTALRSLEVRKTGHTDDVLKLASLLPRLETLVIGDNGKFTDKGLAFLGESKSLKSVEIRNTTGITEEAIKAFQTKYPKINLLVSATGEHE